MPRASRQVGWSGDSQRHDCLGEPRHAWRRPPPCLSPHHPPSRATSQARPRSWTTSGAPTCRTARRAASRSRSVPPTSPTVRGRHGRAGGQAGSPGRLGVRGAHTPPVVPGSGACPSSSPHQLHSQCRPAPVCAAMIWDAPPCSAPCCHAQPPSRRAPRSCARGGSLTSSCPACWSSTPLVTSPSGGWHQI